MEENRHHFESWLQTFLLLITILSGFISAAINLSSRLTAVEVSIKVYGDRLSAIEEQLHNVRRR